MPRSRKLTCIAIGACAIAGCGSSSTPARRGMVFSVPAKLPPRAHATPTAATPAPPPASPPTGGPPRPDIVRDLIPFDAKRKAEMAAYAQRHYGFTDYHLRHPHVVVEHYTASTTFSAAYNTFAPDVPDAELHELPGTCAHFVIDRDGTTYQLVPLSIMCRHTVGLNWTAIGIEHVGMSDQDVMSDKPQLAASLALTTWLRCHFRISIAHVIGHNESLSSPYHHENVAALRTQTHADMQAPTMRVYRADLARRTCGS